MARSKRDSKQRDLAKSPEANREANREALQPALDELALQIVRRAARKTSTGEPLEALTLQLNALKIAGSYFAATEKLRSGEDEADEGSAWGDLARQLSAAEDIEDDAEADTPARH